MKMTMNTYEKLEWIHCAIQEALHGNLAELPKALEMVEDMREPYLFTRKIDLYDSLTSDELKQVTDIFLETLSRKEGITPEVFELETNILLEGE